MFGIQFMIDFDILTIRQQAALNKFSAANSYVGLVNPTTLLYDF